MNPRLGLLQPYPFERLRALAGRRHAAARACAHQPRHRRAAASDAAAPQGRAHREPRRARALSADRGPARAARGASPRGSRAATAWAALDAETQVIPVTGSREALFAIAQAVLDPAEARRARRLPQPVLPDLRGRDAAGRRAALLRELARRATACRPTGTRCPSDVWKRTRLVYRLLAQQSQRARDDARGVAAPVRALGPPRLRHRLRRVLQRDLLRRVRSRRWARSPRRSSWAARATRASSSWARSPSARTRPGLRSGFAAGDARDPRELRALSHLPRHGDEQHRAARLDRGLEGRGARGREPAPLPREVRGLLRAA